MTQTTVSPEQLTEPLERAFRFIASPEHSVGYPLIFVGDGVRIRDFGIDYRGSNGGELGIVTNIGLSGEVDFDVLEQKIKPFDRDKWSSSLDSFHRGLIYTVRPSIGISDSLRIREIFLEPLRAPYNTLDRTFQTTTNRVLEKLIRAQAKEMYQANNFR